MTIRILSLFFLLGQVCAAVASRPNILFIVSEDNGPELGCYGDKNAIANEITPTLDQLARDGVMFQNAFVPYSVCSPSRACFYTGTHVAQNGHLGLATHKFAMYEAYPTFYKLLRDSGYRTGLIGKLHINPASAVSAHVDFRAISGANFGQGGRNMRNYATQANRFITGDYDGAEADKPFVLTINYPDAHLPMHHLAPTGDPQDADTLPKNPVTREEVTTIPWVGTSSDRLLDQTAGYYNCLRRLDDGIAMVLDHLEAAGLSDDTLVIYIGDHGAQFSRGKTSVYEAGLRVPMIVRWPGKTVDLPGEFNAREELASTTDIMPTMLAAAGVPIPSHCSGFPLQPLLAGKKVPWRKYIFGHTAGSAPVLNYVQLSVRDERFKLISNPFKAEGMPDSLRELSNRSAIAYLGGKSHFSAGTSQAELEAATTPAHVREAYARYLDPPRYELYDLNADPCEWMNLADDPAHAATLKRLIGALAAWQDDPVIADPWRVLENVERFGTMQELAIGTNYKGKGGFSWDYLRGEGEWNYPVWRKRRFPAWERPTSQARYSTGFETGEGFGFPEAGKFALFPAAAVTDSSGGVWTGDGSSSGVWNRADIPPQGVQALRVGRDGGGKSSVQVRLPESLSKLGRLTFSYANYSQSTDCTARVLVREAGEGAWEQIWEKSFRGLQVDWKDKPWPQVDLDLDRDGGGFELRFETEGSRGAKIDQLAVWETPGARPLDYDTWKRRVFEDAPDVGEPDAEPDGDPDGDGLPNRLEFLLNQSPTTAGRWYRSLQLEPSGYTVVRYERNLLAAGPAVHLEVAADLNRWIRIGRDRVIAENEAGIQTVEVAIPPMNGVSGRLQVRAATGSPVSNQPKLTK